MTAPLTDLTTQASVDASLGGDQPGGPAPSTVAPGPGGGLAAIWRRSRALIAVIAFVIAGVALVVLLAPTPKSNTYLDPADSGFLGTKALADLLGERGIHLTAVYSPADALAAIRSIQASSRPVVTLVITRPDLLNAAQRTQLVTSGADLVLVEPGKAALRAFAPSIRLASSAGPFGVPVEPACALPGARLAGSAYAGGITYRGPSYAIGCYPVRGSPSVVTYRVGGRAVTILGSGLAFANGLLAQEGNAALALNLLNARSSIVWLTPEPTVAAAPPPITSHQPAGPSLIPDAAWLVVLQLAVALLLAAIWRARRFGPLIYERLPVVVRASETVEGHARLYQSRRARDRAASALREHALSRILPALGLAADAPADAVADSLASRSRLGSQEIMEIFYGRAPASDADLVRLAHDLDAIERQVRSQ